MGTHSIFAIFAVKLKTILKYEVYFKNKIKEKHNTRLH